MGRHVFIVAGARTKSGCRPTTRGGGGFSRHINQEEKRGVSTAAAVKEGDTDKSRRDPELKCHDLERAALFVVFN